MCLPPNSFCTNDNDCERDEKCCKEDCGERYHCVKAVFTKQVITTPAQESVDTTAAPPNIGK